CGDQRNTQAVGAVLVLEPVTAIVLGQDQGAELLGRPAEAVMHHREREPLAVLRRQLQLLARGEPAGALGGANAFGESSVVQVAGKAKTRVEGRGARVEALQSGAAGADDLRGPVG